MQMETQGARRRGKAAARIGNDSRRRAEAWPHIKQSELVERLNDLGHERLVKVLVLKRPGDPRSPAEGVWVLTADGDQDAGTGVLLSKVVSLDGRTLVA